MNHSLPTLRPPQASRSNRRLAWGLCGLLLSSVDCGRSSTANAPSPSAPALLGSSSRAAAGPAPSSPSAAPFGDGERTFRSLLETLRSKYYRTGLSDDELYRAASAGLLQQLEPQLSAWNRLLSPEELRDLSADLKGDIVGIGVEIHFDEESGISDVLSVLPGSPAEQAGLHDGDKLLTVAGRSFRGKSLHAVVAELRGPAGAEVELTLLRDSEVRSVKLRRQRVAYDVVKTLLLPGEVGYLYIHQFTDQTADAVARGLSDLRTHHLRGLILDLRGNQGGLFQSALATAEHLLPKATKVVTLRHRGGREETLLTQRGATAPALPLAVLIDHDTASSGELLAGALHEGLRAPLIGQKSLGKGSIQELTELPNHYAVKYTISVFVLPSGQAVDGQGLAPDIDVALPIPPQSTYDRQLSRLQHQSDAVARLQADRPLAAALHILRLELEPQPGVPSCAP